MTPTLARRLFALLALAAGLAVATTTITFQLLPEVRAASACARATSLMEFQQARSMADLIAVFSAPGGQCRAPMVAAMDAQNKLDLALYIPVYALFLLSAAAAFVRLKSPLFLMALAAVAAAVAGDLLETLTQLAITDDVEAARPLLAPLASGYWLKYAGLAAHAAVTVGIAVRAGGRFWWLALAAGVPPLLFAASATGFDPPMILGFGAFWFALLVAAGFVAFSRNAPPTAHPEPAPGASSP